MDEVLDIISATCLKHRDSGEASTMREARLIVAALKESGYTLVKTSSDKECSDKSSDVRSVSFGDIVKAKCTAPARAIDSGRCVYISAMCNELCIDDIDMEADWANEHDLPLPSDEDLKNYV